MGYKYKRVYLTEKDSQVEALSIVENAKRKGLVAYNDEKKIAIVPLQGHVLINEDVKKYAEEFDRFEESSLKKFPDRLKLRVNPRLKTKYKTAIEHLKDAEEIVIATDFDEEGAAIGLNMIKAAGAEHRIAFMLEMGSTHPVELRKYIDNPTNIPYKNLAESARARAWIDFVEGMYFSRALSMYLGNNYQVKLNYGGVKAPLTYIVVERDLAYENHKISYFWTISGIAIYNGQEFKVDIKYKKEEKIIDKKTKKERIKTTWETKFDSENEAKEALRVLENKDLKVNIFNETTEFSGPPKLYDLGGIQAEMSNKFRVKPAVSLEMAQKNYDSPVSIQAYPRTEVPYLKEAEYEDVPKILQKLKAVNIVDSKIIDQILSDKIPKRSSTFNDKEVVAHGAIVPTLSGDYNKWLSKLDKLNIEMFKLVAKRYIANFMPDYKYLRIAGETEVINDQYKVTFSENIPLDNGWKDIYGETPVEKAKKREIPEIKKGESIRLKTLTNTKGETKPKPPFSMAGLLSAMEKVANLFPDNEEIKKHLKESGIGTPATRSKIIEEVMDFDKNGGEPWLIEKSNKIRSTEKARDYISVMPIELVSPIKRALLSKKLKMISKGELTYEKLISEYRNEIEKNIELIKKIAKENGPIKGAAKTVESLGKCPKCGGDIIEKKKVYLCSNAKYKKEGDKFINEGCDYTIFKSALDRFGKRNLLKSEVMKLLKNGSTEVTLTAKGSGKKYSAVIVTDLKYGISVDFNAKRGK